MNKYILFVYIYSAVCQEEIGGQFSEGTPVKSVTLSLHECHPDEMAFGFHWAGGVNLFGPRETGFAFHGAGLSP
jgi:hypothetical protein